MSERRIVERSDVEAVLTRPTQEYTRRLVGAVPNETVVREPWPAPVAASKELA